MTPDKLCCAIRHRVAARDDGLALQIALNITGHLLRGPITAFGLLAHRHDDDIVQIASEDSAKSMSAGTPGVRNSAGIGRIIHTYGMAGQRGILLANRPFDIRE